MGHFILLFIGFRKGREGCEGEIRRMLERKERIGREIRRIPVRKGRL
jgi:hypothetical protein